MILYLIKNHVPGVNTERKSEKNAQINIAAKMTVTQG